MTQKHILETICSMKIFMAVSFFTVKPCSNGFQGTNKSFLLQVCDFVFIIGGIPLVAGWLVRDLTWEEKWGKTLNVAFKKS